MQGNLQQTHLQFSRELMAYDVFYDEDCSTIAGLMMMIIPD